MVPCTCMVNENCRYNTCLLIHLKKIFQFVVCCVLAIVRYLPANMISVPTPMKVHNKQHLWHTWALFWSVQPDVLLLASLCLTWWWVGDALPSGLQRVGKFQCSCSNVLRISTEVELLGGTYALTMVLKHCQSRFKVFGVNHPEKWYDLCFHQDSSFVPTPARALIYHHTSSLTAVNTAPCVRYIVTPSVSNFEKPLWRRRRAPGLNVIHLSAVTHMSTRGN